MISVLFENSFFLVVHKPVGVSTHNESPSLTEWLIEHNKPISFVNRLDQQTSGLILVAKRPEWHEPLSQSLHHGRKFYRALLRGSIQNADPTLPQVLNWNWPLSDKSEGRKNPQGKSSDRKNCLTLTEIVRTNSFFTEVICEIKTGRQHQIRKHAALAKHPIVGDPRYNEPAYNEKIFAHYQSETPRMYLNAEQLQFKYEKEEFDFKSEKLNLDAYFQT